MEQYDLAFTALDGRHQRRAVVEARPDRDARAQPRRVGQHLAVYAHVRWDRQTSENRTLLERRQRLWRRPRQRAAERAPAEPQRHREQIVAALFKPGSGEPDQDAALLDPGLDPLVDVARQRADIGQHQRAHLLLERQIDIGGDIGVLGAHHFGERGQRLLDVIQRRQQRLRLLAVFARDEPDAVPLRARVQQTDRACRALAGNLDARDLVAQFERQLKRNTG